MSEWGPPYDPFLLIPQALANDCESEEETSALLTAQNALAQKTRLKKLRSDIVRLTANTAVRETETFKKTVGEQILKINEDIAFYEAQISEILDSYILDDLLFITYEKLHEEELRSLHEKMLQQQAPSASTDVEANVATESVPVEQPEIPKRYSVKEKLINALGAAGGILWFILSSFVYILPILMIGKGFWLNLLFFGIMQIFPASSIVFWVWGLVGAITGPQDIFAIIYYVVFAVAFIPFFINIITGMFRKD